MLPPSGSFAMPGLPHWCKDGGSVGWSEAVTCWDRAVSASCGETRGNVCSNRGEGKINIWAQLCEVIADAAI